MSEKKRRWRLFSWISPQHRLVVINDGSFREESSLRLSVRNALFITLAFVALWLLSAFALARLIGGSGDPYKADAAAVANMSEDDIRQQLLQIHRQLDSLESEIVTRDIYIDKIQKVVINDGSFREESSLRLSVRNALFITLAFVALWLLSAFALARLIGGSGDPYKADAAAVANMSEDDIRQQLLQIHRQLDSLESEIVTRDIYIDKIQKVLNNNVETEKDIKSKREQLAQLDTNQPRVGSKEMPEKNEAVRKMMQTTAIDADIANAEPQPSSPSNASSSSNTSADFANAIVRLEQISFLPPLRGIISDTFSASV